ncbi:DUF4232 domain-containing protein [Streptomyces sp. S.PB5]|uniref:DUF4232 domain-containing protein n=1 Tax=Streptomyces sp. S.PB5 TaxID=3020844 RepID=UPI0025AF3884|nr:DUF4232 domain-containing protein [Streptomyces sp. S.PB5]MDN3023542.1 DUF4232 domain-containing protein [Streptomyces sp. S.PB5]
MFTRTHRTRVLAAAALMAATLTLTACNSGDGVNDEGAPAGSASTSSGSPSTGAGEGTGGTGKADQTGANSEGSTGGSNASSGTTGGSGATGTSGSSGSGASGSSGSKGSQDSDSDSDNIVACTPATTRTTATEVSRPLNHMLLTVTNTGSKICTLVDYPAVKFTGSQSVPPVIRDSIPQAVVTLAPGESGYAGILLSAADGNDGYTAKSLEVYFNLKANSAAKPSLPKKGVYIDSSIQVTYWQSTMADALAW